MVIHYTAMRSAEAACATLCNPQTQVSAHYLIAEDGSHAALVPEDLRAWHAGAGCWGAVTDVNSRSIGIELANSGDCPFAAAQMDALERLLEGIFQRWSIRPERVIGHSDMAPGRKIDPGPRFDWRRLARGGFAVWPAGSVAGDLPAQESAAAPRDDDVFWNDLRRFGYTAGVPRDVLLAAFRLRFRPRHQGPPDPVDHALAADLARRFPVDAWPATA